MNEMPDRGVQCIRMLRCESPVERLADVANV